MSSPRETARSWSSSPRSAPASPERQGPLLPRAPRSRPVVPARPRSWWPRLDRQRRLSLLLLWQLGNYGALLSSFSGRHTSTDELCELNWPILLSSCPDLLQARNAALRHIDRLLEPRDLIGCLEVTPLDRLLAQPDDSIDRVA